MMRRRPYQPALDPAVKAAISRRYLITQRSNTESAQGYFEVTRDIGRPCVIATQPRTSAEIESFTPEGRSLNHAAEAQMRRYAETALAGSRAKRKEIFTGAETGVVRGVQGRNVAALCEVWADVLDDPRSYLGPIDLAAERARRRPVSLRDRVRGRSNPTIDNHHLGPEGGAA